MADTKISELAEITTLDGTEEFVVADGGTTKKINAANLETEVGGSGTPPDNENLIIHMEVFA